MGKKQSRFGPGCLSFIVIYAMSLLVLYFVTTPTTMEDFTGRTAEEFSIAGVLKADLDEAERYRIVSLERMLAGRLNFSDFTFLLPQKKITIYAGDIHSAEILEDNGDWQLVAFYYSNTRTSTSVYRAYTDRIEPISYRVTSSVGQMFGAVFLLIPAFVLSGIIAAIFSWRARRAAKTKES